MRNKQFIKKVKELIFVVMHVTISGLILMITQPAAAVPTYSDTAKSSPVVAIFETQCHQAGGEVYSFFCSCNSEAVTTYKTAAHTVRDVTGLKIPFSESASINPFEVDCQGNKIDGIPALLKIVALGRTYVNQEPDIVPAITLLAEWNMLNVEGFSNYLQRGSIKNVKTAQRIILNKDKDYFLSQLKGGFHGNVKTALSNMIGVDLVPAQLFFKAALETGFTVSGLVAAGGRVVKHSVKGTVKGLGVGLCIGFGLALTDEIFDTDLKSYDPLEWLLNNSIMPTQMGDGTLTGLMRSNPENLYITNLGKDTRLIGDAFLGDPTFATSIVQSAMMVERLALHTAYANLIKALSSK